MHTHSNFQKPLAGVSLVETLVVMGILGVLTSLALPSLENMLGRMRERSVSSAFAASVYRARNEAILRNARVVLCKAPSGVSCASDGGWERGWIIFHDANNNAQIDEGETLLHTQLLSQGNLRIWGNSPVADYISFTGIGVPKMVSGKFQAGTLIVCSASAEGTAVRHIVLNKPGNIRTTASVPGACN